MRPLPVAIVFLVLLSCSADKILLDPDAIARGTWGANNAGMIVADTSAHVHIGCTYGDVRGLIPLDDDGRFDVAGSYLLRAFPVAVGPTMPARFTGRVQGHILSFTVTVNDTVEKTTKVLGPVSVQYGKAAQMGPCPICRLP